MTQITHGLRSILSYSLAYDAFQRLVGADSFRRSIVAEYLVPPSHGRILDIGCGTAEILGYLPDTVEYVGFDASEAYIRSARARFGHRGSFLAQRVSEASLEGFPPFDLAMAIGLIHHLGDDEAVRLFRLAARALKADGRFCTVDPCVDERQGRVARAVIRRDRGRNVRDLAGYRSLASMHFGRVDASVRHDLLRIPYTHATLICSGPIERP